MAGVTEQRFNYMFYVDFIGALSEERCQNALRHLQVCICLGLCCSVLSNGIPCSLVATVPNLRNNDMKDVKDVSN